MGGFRITYIWSEKSNGFVVIRYRMEKLDLMHKSWWGAENSGSSPWARKTADVKALEKQCDDCHETFKQVYQGGWMCLNEKCGAHWKLNGVKPTDADLKFHEAFLLERTEPTETQAPFSTVPKLSKIDRTSGQEKTFSVKAQCWRGIVCEDCGRCNQRQDWDAWRCYGTDCHFEYAPQREIIPASAVMGDSVHPFEGLAISDDSWDANHVTCERKTHGSYLIHDYSLAHDSIKITHVHSNSPINAKPGGADDVFRGLQEANIDFKRLPMKHGRGKPFQAPFL